MDKLEFKEMADRPSQMLLDVELGTSLNNLGYSPDLTKHKNVLAATK